MVGTSNKSDVGVAIEWRVPIHGTQLVGPENPMMTPPGPYKFHEECYGDTWGYNML